MGCFSRNQGSCDMGDAYSRRTTYNGVVARRKGHASFKFRICSLINDIISSTILN